MNSNIIEKESRFKKLRKNVYKNRYSYYLMAPYLLIFGIFTVISVIMSILFSFTNFNLLELPRFVGFDNYVRLFLDDEVFIIAIKNTLILAIITGPISFIIAFVIAWLINELPRRWKWFMTLVFYAPSISGNAYLLWKLIFSSDMYGYANSTLLKNGLITEPITWLQDPRYVIWIIIIVQFWLSLGVAFLAFIAGLQNMDHQLYEAGAIDGIRNRWQELWYITLPQMRPQLMFGAVMQITSSFGIASVSSEIAGYPSIDYAGQTIVLHLLDYGGMRFEMGYASAIASILFMIMLSSNIVVQKFLRRVGS
ncbi:MAG: ABC-type transport system, permease component [Haloplasmataceae bacterium]|jgi:multiple sugar transport system permease protein|nr:ABC-type transport system, permease component [Haloplasmataceae bacterium]